MPRKRAYAQAEPWLERLGWPTAGSHRSGELSGGQAQRVAIARALVVKPQVLFADEPTGSLDTLSGENVMNLLVTSAREEGATVVLVTHDARVAAYADREVIVRDGKAMSLHQPFDGAEPGAATAQAPAKKADQAEQTDQADQAERIEKAVRP